MIHHPRLPVLVHHLGSVLRVMFPIPKPILKRLRAHGKPLVFRQIRIRSVRCLHERPVSDRLLLDGRLFPYRKRRRPIHIIRPRSPGGLVRKRRNLDIVPVKNHVIIRLLFLRFPAGIAVCVPDALNAKLPQGKRSLLHSLFPIPRKTFAKANINLLPGKPTALHQQRLKRNLLRTPDPLRQLPGQRLLHRLALFGKRPVPIQKNRIIHIQLYLVIGRGRHARPDLYLVQMIKKPLIKFQSDFYAVAAGTFLWKYKIGIVDNIL